MATQVRHRGARLDVLYEDKLDGRIDAAFFDRKAKEFRAQQNTILKSIEDHQSANQSYMEEGIRILELASRAAELFEKQSAEEKRRLLNCVLKGTSWQHGRLKADFRQPFDMLAKTALSNSASDSKENPIETSKGEKEIWLPTLDSNSRHGSLTVNRHCAFRWPTPVLTAPNGIGECLRRMKRTGG